MALCLPVSAQLEYRTAELKRLATVLHLNDSVLHDGYNYISADGRQIVVAIKGRTVNHVGLCLFSESMREAGQTPVFDFLERYFLQQKYPPISKTAKAMTQDNQFHFVKGSLQTVDQLMPSDVFSFAYDNRLYTASWNREGHTLLSVTFPVEYELISGENKIEAENHIFSDIKTADIRNSVPVQIMGDSYLDGQFSSRLYRQKGQLVSSERHPAETVANMMLSLDAKGSYDINVTEVCYGFKKTVFQVPLRQWIAFCQNSGCQLFIGIEDIGQNGDVNAVVMAVNEAENYNHVLTVVVPAEIISHQSGCIEARLYPYVPNHNVSNLFATYRKSNSKTFVNK